MAATSGPSLATIVQRATQDMETDDFAAITAPDTGTSDGFPAYKSFALKHQDCCRVARFSPDGKYLATGGADNAIKVLDVAKIRQKIGSGDESGQFPGRTYTEHMGAINDIDFHPFTTLFASCGKDRAIRFFDLTKGRATKTIHVCKR